MMHQMIKRITILALMISFTICVDAQKKSVTIPPVIQQLINNMVFVVAVGSTNHGTAG